MKLDIVEIGQLPFFNQDIEQRAGRRLQVVWKQRLEPRAWCDRQRPSAIGAFGANHHLRQSLVFLNVPAMRQPEAYIGHADKLFDEHGKLVNDGTRKFLQDLMRVFANWVETLHLKVSTSDALQTLASAELA